MNTLFDLPEPEGAEPFTVGSLIDAVTASAGNDGPLQTWGSAVIDAIKQLTDARGRAQVGPALDLLSSTAQIRQQPISPFAGLIEAPRNVAAVYQANKRSLKELESAQRETLTSVLEDFATEVMTQLQGVSWGQLEELGATPQRPPEPPLENDEPF